MFKLGLIINPLAGLGGSVALKGSDHVAQEALALGAQAKAGLRTVTALSVIKDLKDQIELYTCAGDMGESVLKELDWPCEVVYSPKSDTSSAEDSQQAALALKTLGMDLIVFAGGDGTARDICAVIQDDCPVLGIPAGVKIHSGVYGITPSASGEVIRLLVTGQLVDLKVQDVRDIDEDAFRNNQVKAKLYGEMLVPQAGQFVQSVKQGGIEQEELVLDDLAAYLSAELETDVVYLIGSGKTTQHFMEYLNLPNTLLGVDAVLNEEVIAQDISEQKILSLLDEHPKAKIMVSVIGGQGHVFGRGNQQLSSEVIKRVGRENLMILSTKTKLAQLEGRPLIVDTSDTQLDQSLAGHIEVITGYQDKVLYPIE